MSLCSCCSYYFFLHDTSIAVGALKVVFNLRANNLFVLRLLFPDTETAISIRQPSISLLYRHLLPAQGAKAPLSEPQLLRRLRWDGGEGLAQDARGQEGQGRVRADRRAIRQEVQSM